MTRVTTKVMSHNLRLMTNAARNLRFILLEEAIIKNFGYRLSNSKNSTNILLEQ